MTSPWPRGRCWALMGAIFVLGVGVDQITKAAAIAYLTGKEPVPVVSDILQLALVRNPGAAFSTGEGMTPVFAILSAVVLIAVGVGVVPRVRSGFGAVLVGMGAAGVAGNFIDRLIREPGPLRGHVIDFLALKYFAVFNVADILLTSTAVLVIVSMVFFRGDLLGRRSGESAPDGAAQEM